MIDRYGATLQVFLVPAGPVPVERLIDRYGRDPSDSPTSPPAPCR